MSQNTLERGPKPPFPAQQQEPPTLAMAHSGVGRALEEVQVGDDVVQESRGAARKRLRLRREKRAAAKRKR